MAKTYLCFIVEALCLIINCTAQTNTPQWTAPALYAHREGNGIGLSIIIDNKDLGIIVEKPASVVLLEKPSAPVSIWTGFKRKDCLIDSGDGHPIVIGKISEQPIDGWFTPVFSPKSSTQKPLACGGDGGGNIYGFTAKGESVRIGESKYIQLASIPSKNKYVRIVRLEGAECFFNLDDKIYLYSENDKFVQAGWLSWRKITRPDGTQTVILMTKSMKKGASWAGRDNDVLYLDK